jgi:hypothetical protein
MAMRLILRTHPADSTLLEVMLEDEQGRENRVARAPLANPRAWEWTTPPSWLRREDVERLLDVAEQAGNIVSARFEGWCCSECDLAEVEVDGPRLPGVKALQKAQKTALASMHDALTLCTVGPTGVIE